MFSIYNVILILTGNDIGPQSIEVMYTGILLLISGALMNANIFSTMAIIF